MANQTKYNVSVLLDGENFNPSEGQLYSIRIIESCYTFAPTLKLEVLSNGSVLTDTPLYDGQKLNVSIASLETGIEGEESIESEQITVPFRLFNYTVVPFDPLNYKITLSAIMDVPDIFASRSESFHGTSSNVFQQMAERIGLTAVVDPTNDSQVWIRPGLRGGAFLSEVANHSWSNEGDFMVWALRKEGELALLNMNQKLKRTDADWTFNKQVLDIGIGSPDVNEVLYRDYEIRSTSGLQNQLFGYGMDVHTYVIENGERVKIEMDELDRRNVNWNVNKELSTFRNHDSLPFDCGNTHQNYHKAKYQNLRAQSLFSLQVQCSSRHPRRVKLLDTVDLEIPIPSLGKKSNIYQGRYVVSKTVTHVNFKKKQMWVNYFIDKEGLNLETPSEALVS